jgi:DNA-binding CsgD family transcriptional regulator
MNVAIGLADWRARCNFTLRHENELDVFAGFVELAADLGYGKIAYGLEFPNSIPRPDFCYFSNFPPDWRVRFSLGGTRQMGAKSAVGKRTSSAGSDNELHWRRDDFMREAVLNDVHFIWLESIPGFAGTTSFVGLAGGLQYPSAQLRKRIKILIDQTSMAMTMHLVPKHMPQSTREITDTERQCLQWVLDGKTAEEIARILQTQVSAIRHLQRKLCTRFDKVSIFATAVLAFRMGLLSDENTCLNADILGTSVIRFDADDIDNRQ